MRRTAPLIALSALLAVFLFLTVLTIPVLAGGGGGGGGGASTCGAGQYESGGCHSCPAGKYQDSTSHSSGSCKNCPAGKSSGSGAGSCSNCGCGKYSGAGGSCSNCPSGKYSGSGSSSCSGCSSGKYSGSGSCSCSSCPSGRYSGSTAGSCSYCPKGQYASGTGNTGCTSCGTGKYQSNTGQSSCSSCPAGRYGSSTGLTSSSCSGAAPAGRYTNAGATSAGTNCPAGRYASVTGSTSSSCQGQCSAGYYCPSAGSTSATPFTCNAGRYGSSGQTSATCSGSCSAGYFCPAGSSSSTANQCAAAISSNKEKYYCPSGSGSRSTVSTGYYSTPESTDSNRRTGQSQCGPGYYCSNGVRRLCPAGRYSSRNGESSSSCEGPCEAGFYCPSGSDSARAVQCGSGKSNPAAWYCPTGSSSPSAVSPNFYSTPEDVPIARRTGQSLCGGLYICSNGVRELKLKWTDQYCKDGGNPEMAVVENVADQVMGTVSVQNNLPGTPSVSYTVSATKPAGCLIEPSFAASGSSIRSGSTLLDHETCPSYSVLITATADGHPSPPCEVHVWVDDQNEAPSLGALPTYTLEETVKPGYLFGSSIAVTDPDFGQTRNMKFAIVGGSGSSKFDIHVCSGELSVRSTLLPGTYTLNLQATDPGGLTASTSTSITVLRVNRAPAFDFEDYGFTLPENPLLNTPVTGTRSGPAAHAPSATDPDFDSLTYSFVSNDRNAFKINPETGVISVAAPNLFDYERPTNFPASPVVKVTDGQESITITVPIAVTNVNEKPSVSGATVHVSEAASVGDNIGEPLSASDPDAGDSLSWSIVSGSGASLLSVTSTGQLRLAQAVDYEAESTEFSAVVSVTDGGGLSATANVKLIVDPANEAPVVSSITVDVDENTETPLALSPALSVTDPDGDSVFFVVTSGNPVDEPAKFTVDPATGAVQVSGPLNHEAAATYTLDVSVSDNGNPVRTTPVTVTVNVHDVNEAPYVFPGQQFLVAENSAIGTVVGSLDASDVDSSDVLGSTLTFQALSGSSAFALSPAGQLTVADPTQLDFEAVPGHELTETVTVVDSGGLSHEADVTVRLVDMNDAPQFPATTRAVPVSTPASGLVGIPVRCTDQDLVDQFLSYTLLDGGSPATTVSGISIDPTSGQLFVSSASATSAAGTIALRVRCTDHESATAEDDVTVKVVAANAVPTAPDGEVLVAEDKGAGFEAFVVAGTDANGADTLTYKLEYADPVSGFDLFSVDSSTGSVTLTGDGLDFESGEVFRLGVSVTDNGPGPLSSLAVWRVVAVDVSEPPVIVPAAPVMTVDENVGTDTVIGTIVATDADDGDVVTITMPSTTVDGQPHPFVVNPSTGVVSTRSSSDPGIDFEAVTQYKILVTAKDSVLLPAEAVLTINVRDVNEAPAASPATFTDVPEDARVNTAVGTVDASDVDAGTTLTYSITAGNVGGAFRFEGNQLVTAAALDYETLPAYSLTVRVFDGELGVEVPVSVSLANVNDLTITGFTGTAHSTAGGDEVIIHGSNFGQVDGTPIDITAEYTSSSGNTYASTCAITEAGNNKKVTCVTAPGTGSELLWTLTVGDHSVTASSYTTYLAPSIVSVDDDEAIPTAGNTEVILRGTDFGPLGQPALVTYGPPAENPSASGTRYLAVNCTVTEAHVAVTCVSVPGIGTDLYWRITVDGLDSDISSAVGAYAPPAITGVLPPSPEGEHGGLLDTRGGEEVLVVGDNFGESGSVDATYGPSGVEYSTTCAVVVPHTTLACPSVVGIGAGHQWLCTVGGQVSDLSTDTTSYRRPVITELGGPGAFDGSTFGGQAVVVIGDQFGPVGDVDLNAVYGRAPGTPAYPEGSLQDELGYTARDCRVTVAHVQMSCITSPGTGKGHSWRVTVASQDSDVFDANTNYHVPVISGYGGDGAVDAVTPGAETIVLEGREFGPEGTPVQAVTYGPNGVEFTAADCEQTTDWAACAAVAAATGGSSFSCLQTITCKTAPGAGANLFWLVTVDHQESVYQTTNYEPPRILAFNGPVISELSTDGGDVVTLVGTNFATQEFFDYVTYGPTGLEYTPSSCTVTSHHTMDCTTVPGTGPSHWVVSVGGQVSEPSEAITRYAAPAITSITPTSLGTEGGMTLTVRGTNFGLRVPGADVYIAYESGWTPFSGGLVEGTGSEDQDPLVMPQGTVKVDPSTTRVVELRGEHVLTMPIPHGFGADRKVAVVVDNVISNVETLSFVAPSVSRIHVIESPDRPSYTRIFVFGEGFCKDTSCGQVWLDDQLMTLIVSWSHEEVVFDALTQGGAVTISVGLNQRPDSAAPRVSEAYPFLFFSPVVFPSSRTAAAEREFSTAGGETLTIEGKYFGTQAVNVTVGGKPCTDLRVEEKSLVDQIYEITCKVPPGVGPINPVVVWRFAQSSDNPNFSFNIKYGNPSIDSISFADHSAVGSSRRELAVTGPVPARIRPDGRPVYRFPTVGADVVLSGSNFGAGGNGTTLQVLFGATSLPVVEQDHTTCYVSVPPGDGGERELLIVVGGQFIEDRVYVEYEPPVVESISPTHGSTAGGETITITGSNFGVTPPTITLGGSPCTLGPGAFVPSLDHTTVTCIAPAGQGVEKTLELSVSSQDAAPSAVRYDYDIPQVFSVFPSHGPTAGWSNHTVVGMNFGFSGTLHLVSQSEGASVEVPPAQIMWYNHTHITFSLPPGQGVDYVPRVTVESTLVSEQTHDDVYFEYDPPSIHSISPLHGPTAGGYILVIEGESLGTQFASVSLGGKPCVYPDVVDEDGTILIDVSATPIHDHDVVRCVVPQGIGIDREVRLSIGRTPPRRAPETLYFYYDPPIVFDLVPNNPDALGDRVEILGKNFGWEPTPVVVNISGLACDASWKNDAALICSSTQNDIAGSKNVTITVANQTSFFHESERRYVTECKKHHWGLEGEYCLPCPEGGVCEGRGAAMYSDSGFWLSLVATPSTDCEGGDLRQHREECPFLQPCEPPESCLGNNTCARGYTADRCSECVKGKYYRLGGECVKCPNNPWLVVALFVAACIGLALGGYVLSRKSVHLAFLSIGVDYFQVLALFRRSRIEWPGLIKDIFHYMSAFNLNLDIAAPECAVPEVSYKQKWLFIQALPVVAGAFFVLIHLSAWAYKRCIICRHKRTTEHGAVLVNMFIVMFYFLYLYLTRTTLDIFNCQPTTPDDGHEYMIEIFERCWVKGGTQMTLLPLAVVTLIVYVLGFPAFIGFILYNYKGIIMADQVLRALGKGDNETRYPDTFPFRRKFHKLYYHFKPDFHYWILCIITRKCLIAFTSLMFLKTPSFQLALVLLILFASYSLQVRYEPYMSISDRPKVVDLFRNHPKKDTSHVYVSLASMIERETRLDRSAMKHTMMDAYALRNTRQQALASRAATFLWDYNTVEALMTACLILITLAGIMFESGRFDTGDFDTQKNIITWATLFVIFFSMTYFFVVFTTEVLFTINPNMCTRSEKDIAKMKRMQADKKRKLAAKYGEDAVLGQGQVFTMEGGIAMQDEARRRGLGGVETTVVDPNALMHAMNANPMLAKKKTQAREEHKTVTSSGSSKKQTVARTKFAFAPTTAGAEEDGGSGVGLSGKPATAHQQAAMAFRSSNPRNVRAGRRVGGR